MGSSAYSPKKKTLVTLAITMFVAIIFFLYIQNSFFLIRVLGNSMEPALENGDFILAVPKKTPNRFDLVVLNDPTQPGRNIIKRLIAFAGETMEFKEGRLYINNRPEPLPSACLFISELQHNLTLRVPTKNCIVLGDNTYSSQDSRQYGPINADLIWAKALFRLWPPKLLTPVS